jgi:Tol biopolymer transport system component
MAEHESLGFDTNTAMFIRFAVLHNLMPDKLSQVGGYFMYRVGESFWHFIVDTYGRSKITQIFQKMQNFNSVPRAFESALGLNMSEVTKKWKEFYKKRYAGAVATRKNMSDIGQNLTKEGGGGHAYYSPAFSPQGDKIALITNKNNALSQVIVINAITGKKIKTLVNSTGSTNFEYFNILQPNISWSPDGQKIAFSATAKGEQQLAIVDYNTRKINYIRFKKIDGIAGVAWSPDGKKILFAGHAGPFSDLFLYNLKSHKLTDLTNDVFTDQQPVWGPKGKKIYFISARGNHLQLGQAKDNVRLLTNTDMYSTDLYVLTLGSNRLQRLTKTPKWNETQPQVTHSGRLVFISDKNGIPNIYELHLASRTVTPLTNLQVGVQQMSITRDGSRLAVTTLGKNGTNVYIVTAPFTHAIHHALKNNIWAQRRDSNPLSHFVPAIAYVQKMARSKHFLGLNTPSGKPAKPARIDSLMAAKADTTNPGVPADTTKQDTTKQQNPNNLNFRNYVFSNQVLQDTAFTNKYLKKDVFGIKNNTTEDGRYIPHDYRIKFSPDLVYGAGNFGTYYGVGGLLELRFSDLLGNDIIAIGSNLQFDLRNSIYSFTFANLKHRWKWIFNLSHFAYTPTYAFSSEALRYRYFQGGVTAEYPFNRYTRVDFSLTGINIAQDYTVQGLFIDDNESLAFAYPKITFVKDKSIYGLITPVGGFRYAIRLSGSPPITANTLEFTSIFGDFRKYFNIGRRYSFAVRGVAGASFGPDPQTYEIGGMQGWLNQKYADFSIPRHTLERSFLSPLVGPLRGYKFFALHGDKVGLVNMEFRFPLFAGLLPGPIPILPLFNITGVAFIDAGTAWGQNILYQYPVRTSNGIQEVTYYTNSSALNFKLRKRGTVNINGNKFPEPKGDILVGAGFGLRAIIFGRIPLRWDIGWPYYRDGFGKHAINYISIGIDF